MKLVVGQWLIDSQENQITHVDTQEIIKLEPRAMEVLLYFAQKPDQVISRDELIENIWDGRIVSDHAIYRVINQIRKNLDSSDKDSYLTTLSKKGYKLIQPVSEYVDESVLSKETEIELSIDTQKTTKSAVSNSVKLAILSGLIAIGFYSLWTTTLASKWDYYKKPIYVKQAPLTTTDYFEDYPDYSNDGKFIVYSSKNSSDLPFNLFLKDTQSDEISVLTDSESDWVRAAISNDAAVIVAVKNPEDDCKVMSLTRDDVTKLYVEKELFSCVENKFVDLEISNDGSILYYTYKDDLNLVNRIFSYLIRTGKKSQITNYVEKVALADHTISLSPDNSKLAFLRSIENKTHFLIYDFKTKNETVVKSNEGWVRTVNWSPNSDSLIYQTNSNSIYSYSIKHEYDKPLATGLSSIVRSVHSTSKAELAVVKQDTQYGFWKIVNPLYENQAKQKKQNIEKILFSASLDYFPLYANKSNRIAFVSFRTGQHQIWIRELDGSIRQLTNFNDGRLIHHLTWSPNDRFIAGNFIDGKNLYIVDSETGEVSEMFKKDFTGPGFEPTWSVDGDRIYFNSDVDGDFDIYSVEILDSSINKITQKGIDWLQEISVDKYIYTKSNEKGLWYGTAKENNEKLLFSDATFEDYKYFYVRDNLVYFFDRKDSLFKTVNLVNDERTTHSLPVRPFETSQLSVSYDHESIVFNDIFDQQSKIFQIAP